ncbi:MAG: amidohydrolase family protein [Ancrocorticia populi]|uniref:amidohydrolase family protein n=1 Tax=Ancrocorticia populi TaxID=2175228 RepID=UPI003F904736
MSKNQSGTYRLDNPIQQPTDRVITAKRIFTGRRGGTIADAAVAIQRGRIAWVGSAGELPAEYGALPVESHPEATLTPGFVETHAHLGGFAYEFDPDVPEPERHDQGWHALTSLAPARQLASVGVTTVQSLGARNFADVVLREVIDHQIVAGPRIVASGPQLTTSGGHSWPTGGEVDSITEIKKKIRDHHKAGVDVIKVMATGGFGTFGSAPWNAQFTTEELRALVEEAHRLGKRTAAHAHGTQGIRRSVEAGIDYIAHATFISEDGITRFDPALADQIAEKGIFVDPCRPPSYPAVEGETSTPRAKELYDHGVKIVLGHDIGAVLPPSGYLYGMEQLVASGLPEEEVLIAATSRGAAAVGLAGVTGVIEAGYEADLLVIRGNPIENIADTKNLDEVIIGGFTFQRDHVEPFDPANRWSNFELKPRLSGLDARTQWVERAERAASHPID